MYVCLSDNDENENGVCIVIKMYMYNRKYVLKFYDDDFSLFIGVYVCEILLKRRRTKI